MSIPWLMAMLFALLLKNFQEQPKIYLIKKSISEIKVDGTGSDPAWEQAGLLTDFHLPWDKEIAQPTTFRALWTDQSLYLLYQVIDHEIVAPGPPKDERGVLPSDRVEIFFKVDQQMDPYYCLEMDPRARVLDYQGRFYRHSDFQWNWPENHLKVMASTSVDGYTVEVSISLQSLDQLGILNADHSIDAGLFRGDYYTVDKKKSGVKWISWVAPESEKPDFHIPSAFGKLILAE